MGKAKLLMLVGIPFLLSVSDGNAQWKQVYFPTQEYNPAYVELHPGPLGIIRNTILFYTGDSSSKMIASTDEGRTWKPENAGPQPGMDSSDPEARFEECKFMTALGGNIFAEVDDQFGSARLFVSENSGKSWKALLWPYPASVDTSSVARYGITSVASDGGKYYSLAGSGDIYSFKLDDSVATFEGNISDSQVKTPPKISGGLPKAGYVIPPPSLYFTDLLIRDGIFAAIYKMVGATSGGGVAISRNGGKTWQKSPLDSLQSNPYFIAVNNESIFASTRQGIYRSSDNGVTWVLLEKNVFSDTTIAGKINVSTMYARGRNIFVAGYRFGPDGWSIKDREIYFSDDNGSTWKAIGAGLEYIPWTYILSISQSDSNVFVVAGNRVWKRPISDLPIAIHPVVAGHKNPGLLFMDGRVLHGGDRLDFMVEKSGWVDFGLYDGNGKRLKSLIQSNMPAGSQSVSFSPDKKRIGQFYLRLQTAGTSEARKVFVLN